MSTLHPVATRRGMYRCSRLIVVCPVLLLTHQLSLHNPLISVHPLQCQAAGNGRRTRKPNTAIGVKEAALITQPLIRPYLIISLALLGVNA